MAIRFPLPQYEFAEARRITDCILHPSSVSFADSSFSKELLACTYSPETGDYRTASCAGDQRKAPTCSLFTLTYSLKQSLPKPQIWRKKLRILLDAELRDYSVV